MDILQANLHPTTRKLVPDEIQTRLRSSIPQDVQDLLQHLQPRAEPLMAEAVNLLKNRGKAEANSLIKILEDQRNMVLQSLEPNEAASQAELSLKDENQKQRTADMKYQRDWLANVDGDPEREPARIREFYSVKAHRIEPVGLVYLRPNKE